MAGFDGTLSEVAAEAEEAFMQDGARHALELLACSTPVAVVSGRPLGDLRRRVPVPGVTLAGDYGIDVLLPSGKREASAVPAGQVTEALAAFADLARQALGGAGGSVERTHLAVFARTRGVRERDRPAIQAELARAAAKVAGQSLSVGFHQSGLVTLRAPSVAKGAALLSIRARLAPEAFVLALGFDDTDEEIFREVVPNGLGSKEGPGATAAAARIESPAQVMRLLMALARERIYWPTHD